jgi:hypothetical protein
VAELEAGLKKKSLGVLDFQKWHKKLEAGRTKTDDVGTR